MMLPKTALEEHFLFPELEPYWHATVEDVAPDVRSTLLQRLNDFGESRLLDMDAAAIERAVLSVAGPGVQIERDGQVATRLARIANDRLAEQIDARPNRYLGFAHLALQDARAAADELERCIVDLGFCGAMINGQTNGRYLDEADFYPLWERAADLGAPIYLHPADPIAPLPAVAGHAALKRATWGWTVETASHALRLVFSGLFDRFPGATVILGHLGETLPYLLWRFDSRAKLYGVILKRLPSEIIRQQIVVTTSGMNADEPLNCALAALGKDRILFASDYPFESSKEAADFVESEAIDDETRFAICSGNARTILRLDQRVAKQGNSQQVTR